MRARNLKPGFFSNEVLGSADPLYSILFAGLWGMADREGRLEDRPLRICAVVFPYRRNVTEKRCGAMLDWLDERDFIRRYVAEGRQYIQVLQFQRHQNPHKNEAPSKIPALTSGSHRTRTGGAPEQHPTSTGALGLTPDSGLLTPDSGDPHPPTPSPQPERGSEGAGAPRNGNGRRPRNVRQESRAAWDQVLDCAQHGGQTVGNELIDQAVRLIGGYQRIGQSHESQRRANRERFRETFEALLERQHEPTPHGH